MITSTATLCCALALAVTTGPHQPRYLPTKVEVDVEPLVEGSPAEGDDMRRLERINSERTGARVLERVRQELDRRGVPADGDAPAATVTVRLEWKVYLESHYVAHLVARRDDGTEATVTLECELCDEPKLAAAVAEQVPELLPLLEDSDSGSSGAAPPDGQGPPTTTGPPEGGQERSPKARRIGPAGWIGIGTGAVGIAGIAVGAASVARGTELSLDDEVYYRRREDYRPAGVAFIAVGSALLVTGAVLIVVDQTVLHKRRARRTGKIRVGPSYLGGGGGLSFAGRF